LGVDFLSLFAELTICEFIAILATVVALDVLVFGPGFTGIIRVRVV